MTVRYGKTRMIEITAAEKLDCATRELAMRHRVYPRQVLLKKMTAAESERELRVMAAIVEDYRRVVQPSLLDQV